MFKQLMGQYMTQHEVPTKGCNDSCIDMIMTEENKDASWDVPCSDGENEGDEISLPVVTLYKSIEEKGVLELRVQEYRRPKVSTLEEECGSKESSADECSSKNPLENKPYAEATKPPLQPVVAPSVFDYDDDGQDEDPTETCQLPRRTPKLGRLNRKRCATLQNVISDLKRFHDLDSKGEEDEQVEPEKQPTRTRLW